jgi:hypothetical protein
MPFECAKAVAATFCYNVRFALTPLFGRSFLDACLHPTDPNYGSFKIDNSIIERCTAETQLWLHRSDARQTPSASSRAPSEAPGTPNLGSDSTSAPSFPPWPKFKKLKPKLEKKNATPESGYGTDTDWSEASRRSPQISPKSIWASINRPETPVGQRDCSADEVSAAEGLVTLASPAERSTTRRAEIPRSDIQDEDVPRAKRQLPALDEDYGDDERSSIDEGKPSPCSGPSSEGENNKLRCTDAKTAHLLLQLRLNRSDNDDAHREKRPRTMSI